MRHVHLVGGTKGLGKVFREIAANPDWHFSITARNPTGEYSAEVITGDITDNAKIPNTLRAAVEKKGPIDAIVFFQRWRGDGDSWRGHFETSVQGIDHYIQAARAFMDDDMSHDKSIVIVSSMSSLYVSDEQDAAYHASRTAQIGIMRYYAHTLGSKGIRVNAVSFGNIEKVTNRDFFNQHKELRTAFEQCTPLRRMGKSEEIAKAIRFLVSTDSSWITGQNIVVDGGASVGWIESHFRKQYN